MYNSLKIIVYKSFTEYSFLPQALQSLVDYDEDSDEETNSEDSTTASVPTKRQRLNTT